MVIIITEFALDLKLLIKESGILFIKKYYKIKEFL
jgi:hypothetical protein